MTTICTAESMECDQTSETIEIPVSINFSYNWKLQNIKNIVLGETIKSPIFSNGTSNEIKWCLMITKYLYRDPSNDQLLGYEVKLKLTSSEASIRSLTTNCSFKLLNLIWPQTDKTWQKALKFDFVKDLSCFPIIRNGYLTNDSVITCQINVQRMSKLLIMPKCTWADNHEFLFKNPKFSDVTIGVSDKEFKAHKAILAAQSPVFDAMFEHDMQEAKTNRVNISDIDGEVFHEFLRFIYTGKVNNLENLASDLLHPAEKYGVITLKMLCGKALCENITNENAAEIYVLTHVYNLDQLKAIVRKYIGGNVTDVVNTEGWNLITQSYPSLITEVLCDVAKQIHNKVIIE